MEQAPRTFEEFWPYYVSQHNDARCRWFHFTGTAMAGVLVVASPLAPVLLLAAPVVGYGMSWIGHFAFERNRPASWHSMRHLAWSFRGDMRMFARMATGRMKPEIERAGELYG